MPLQPHKGESKDEYTSRCIKVEIDAGKPQDQAVAICIAKADEHFHSQIDLKSYSDYPDSVKSNAKNVLEWVDKNGWGSCGTGVGKTRANQLANGEPISVDTIQRMYSYLTRHEGDLESSKSYSDGCGKLMYDSWGGLSAKSWAHNKLKELGLIELAGQKISFDYDGTISTAKGTELAKRLIDEGNTVYIISARSTASGMYAKADELGIPHSRVYATGSNTAKVEKIKELGIQKHYDNNEDVVSQLPSVGDKFAKVKKVIFNEDFNEEEAKMYKEAGFKVYIRSSRKVKRKDKKVWNKLKVAGLTEDNLVFGELDKLDKKFNFDLMLTGEDPILEMLSVRGREITPKKVLKSIPVMSMEEAIKLEENELKSVDLKFVNVKIYYKYEEIPGIPPAESGSRTFCKRMLSSNKMYTLEEIKNLPNEHLKKMFKKYDLQPDVFAYRGGFYRLPGTLNTTPWCRHQWTAKVVME